MPICSRHIKPGPAACVQGGGRPVSCLPALLLLVLSLSHISQASAEKPGFNSGNRQVTLLELYTSQGCSSCPPAERWLNAYVDDDDLWTRIVPLAFHVDYWDYIGWKDVYASPGYGERQRDYARAGNARSVYTPGLFSNGREWRGWTLRVNPRASDREPGSLHVAVDAGRASATFDVAGEPHVLHLALLGFDLHTRVERGENRNRTLQQQFVVLAHERHVSGTGHWNVPLPQGSLTAPRYAIAAWVSTPGNPLPLQATGGWLNAISED